MAYQASLENVSPSHYVIYTDAPEESINAIALEIYRQWLSFATGKTSLGEARLINPSGKYASSISKQKTGIRQVAIIQDLDVAPEGRWIEEGHGPIDLKQKPGFWRGRSLPMHRKPGWKGSATWVARGETGFTGFATVGETGWILPARIGLHPSRYLAELAVKKLQSL